MKYQLFPDLTADEYDALRADIRERGVMVPVEVDETGAILDGHHRAHIADSLGIDYPTVVREGWSEDQKLVHVVALNAHRRQLTATERAEVVAQLRRAKLSTRAIAKAVGVDPKTVRNDLSGGDYSPPEITGTDGKTYPAVRDPAESRARAMAANPDLAADEEQLDARARWLASMRQLATIVDRDPDDYIPVLSDTERRVTASRLETVADWVRRAEAALLDAGALRVVGSGR